MDENIRDNLAALKNKINSIEEKYGKQNNSVTLLAVSKSKTVEDITEAYEHGQRHFGENYLQEAQKKIQKLEEYNILLAHCKAIRHGLLQKNLIGCIA